MNLFTQTVTVYRQTAGSYLSGFFSPGVESSFTIKASVQPKDPDTQIIETEGKRSKQAYLLYTTTRLNTVDDSAIQKADEVSILGQRFEVKMVGFWSDLIPHYVVTVEKIEAQ